MKYRKAVPLILLASTAAVAGCLASRGPEVVVYTALDAGFSAPIFERFTERHGVEVLAKYDTESTKTVGLAEAIIAERERPRCDVFWNNEIMHTLRLAEQGLLEPYRSPSGEALPENMRSPDGLWYGFAARARVIIVNTELVSEADRPTSIRDLADARWRGRCGIAKPLFGTTATHAACLFAQWGDEEATTYFESLKANEVQILSGNKQVALAVASGQLVFGMTDTDDAIIEVERGMPVAIIYPDRQPGELGTLFIPNTVAIIKGAPHAEAARKLIDYVLSPEVEMALANSPSAQIPLNPAIALELRVETPRTVQAMQVDWQAAADAWPQAAETMRRLFE